MGIISWIVFGLVAGALAKVLMPGKDPGGVIVTILDRDRRRSRWRIHRQYDGFRPGRWIRDPQFRNRDSGGDHPARVVSDDEEERVVTAGSFSGAGLKVGINR